MPQQLLQDLSTSLECDRSDANRQYWTKYLIQNNVDLNLLTPLFDAKHPIGMRFTWVLGHMLGEAPERITPIVSYCFERRYQWTFPGIKRTVAKMLWLAGVPEEMEGLVVDELFKWMLDPQVKVAVKVYGLEVLYNMVLKYPELEEELRIVIDDQLDKTSVGFKSRAKKILQRLDKKT